MSSQDELSRFDHIPTTEVETDIHDTEAEIKDKEDELAVLMRHPTENKTRIYLLEEGLTARRSFVSKLNEILRFRKDREASKHERP